MLIGVTRFSYAFRLFLLVILSPTSSPKSSPQISPNLPKSPGQPPKPVNNAPKMFPRPPQKIPNVPTYQIFRKEELQEHTTFRTRFFIPARGPYSGPLQGVPICTGVGRYLANQFSNMFGTRCSVILGMICLSGSYEDLLLGFYHFSTVSFFNMKNKKNKKLP